MPETNIPETYVLRKTFFALLVIAVAAAGSFNTRDARALTIGTPDNSWVSTNISIAPDTLPRVDYSSTEISFSGQQEAFPDNDNIENFVSYSGSANVATGELKSSSFAFSDFFSSGGNVGRMGFGERVYIDTPFSGSINVTLTLDVDGDWDVTSGADALGRVEARLLATSGNRSTIFDTEVDGDPFDAGFDPTGRLSVSFPVFDSAPFFDLRSTLLTSVHVTDPGSAIVDFGNTASVDLVLPDGLSFSSESGAFLTEVDGEDTTPIPAPATLLLLLTGLAGFATHVRRKSQAYA